jgi:hypothetical protein
MPNQALFDRVLQRISDDPESFDMSTWCARIPDCGTSACIAGHTALEEGWAPVFNTLGLTAIATKDGRTENIAAAAQEALDLTFNQASYLFQAYPIPHETHAPQTVEEISARWKWVCENVRTDN